jgi:hypothetical protein
MKKRARAGIIGGILFIVLTLPSYAMYFVPQNYVLIFSCWSCLLHLTIFPAVGVFSVRNSPSLNDLKQVSKDSALAGVIAGAIFGTMAFINSIVTSLLGLTERYAQNLPLESQELLSQTGFDFVYTLQGQIAIMLCTIPITIGFGVLLSVLGGIVYRSIKKGK